MGHGQWLFQDESRALHLLSTLFLLLLHQLHLTPSGIRSRRLRTPDLRDWWDFQVKLSKWAVRNLGLEFRSEVRTSGRSGSYMHNVEAMGVMCSSKNRSHILIRTQHNYAGVFSLFPKQTSPMC